MKLAELVREVPVALVPDRRGSSARKGGGAHELLHSGPCLPLRSAVGTALTTPLQRCIIYLHSTRHKTPHQPL